MIGAPPAARADLDLDLFYRRHARVYDLTRFYLADRSRALAALDVRPGHRVIDFACGTGTNLARLAGSGAELVGVDASEPMLEIARRKAPAAELVRGDVTAVSLRPADRAVCTYALSMIPDWEAALANFARHLRPAGVLVVLDFGDPRGAWRAFGPLHRAWFRRFAVCTGLPVAAALRPLFREVTEERRHGGWNFVVRAEGPR